MTSLRMPPKAGPPLEVDYLVGQVELVELLGLAMVPAVAVGLAQVTLAATGRTPLRWTSAFTGAFPVITGAALCLVPLQRAVHVVDMGRVKGLARSDSEVLYPLLLGLLASALASALLAASAGLAGLLQARQSPRIMPANLGAAALVAVLSVGVHQLAGEPGGVVVLSAGVGLCLGALRRSTEDPARDQVCRDVGAVHTLVAIAGIVAFLVLRAWLEGQERIGCAPAGRPPPWAAIVLLQSTAFVALLAGARPIGLVLQCIRTGVVALPSIPVAGTVLVVGAPLLDYRDPQRFLANRVRAAGVSPPVVRHLRPADRLPSASVFEGTPSRQPSRCLGTHRRWGETGRIGAPDASYRGPLGLQHLVTSGRAGYALLPNATRFSHLVAMDDGTVSLQLLEHDGWVEVARVTPGRLPDTVRALQAVTSNSHWAARVRPGHALSAELAPLNHLPDLSRPVFDTSVDADVPVRIHHVSTAQEDIPWPRAPWAFRQCLRPAGLPFPQLGELEWTVGPGGEVELDAMGFPEEARDCVMGVLEGQAKTLKPRRYRWAALLE